MAENPLAKLPLAGQFGLAVVLAALIGGGFYFFFYQDMVQEYETKDKRLATLQADIRNLEVTANKLEEFRREVATREAKLETLKRILPATKETPELMKKVQYLAAQSNLTIRKFTPQATQRKSFEPAAAAPAKAAAAPARPAGPKGAAAKPGPAVAQEFYEEWPINMEVEGSYHNLGYFVDRVSRLARLVTVRNVKVVSQSKQTLSNTVRVTCVATTYVYVEAPESAAGAPAGAK